MGFLVLWLIATMLVGTGIALSARWLGSGILIGAYAGALTTAIFLAGKLGAIPGLPDISLSASIFIYSATFIFTDVLSEVYGKKEARKAVWAGAAVYPIIFISIYFATNWTPHPFWEANQAAFVQTMNIAVRVTIASLLAFLVSQLHDVWAFDFWKKKTRGRHLWLRNNASTMISQLIDTSIFYIVAFYGIFPVFTLIVTTYIVKLVIAAIDTPFTYFVVWFIKKGKIIPSPELQETNQQTS